MESNSPVRKRKGEELDEQVPAKRPKIVDTRDSKNDQDKNLENILCVLATTEEEKKEYDFPPLLIGSQALYRAFPDEEEEWSEKEKKRFKKADWDVVLTKSSLAAWLKANWNSIENVSVKVYSICDGSGGDEHYSKVVKILCKHKPTNKMLEFEAFSLSKDGNLMTSYDVLRSLILTNQICKEEMAALGEQKTNPVSLVNLPNLKVAPLPLLHAFKMSHIYWDTNEWFKHMEDIHTLRRNLPLLSEKQGSAEFALFLSRRTEETRYRLGDKDANIKLDVSNEEFFKPSQKLREVQHDMVHLCVAQEFAAKHAKKDFENQSFSACSDPVKRKIHEDGAINSAESKARPMYEKFKKDLSKAMMSREMFEAAPLAERLQCAQEEVTATLMERKVIPLRGMMTDKKMESCHRWTIKHLVTSMTKGWFREFLIDHYPELKECNARDLRQLYFDRIDQHLPAFAGDRGKYKDDDKDNKDAKEKEEKQIQSYRNYWEESRKVWNDRLPELVKGLTIPSLPSLPSSDQHARGSDISLSMTRAYDVLSQSQRDLFTIMHKNLATQKFHSLQKRQLFYAISECTDHFLSFNDEKDRFEYYPLAKTMSEDDYCDLMEAELRNLSANIYLDEFSLNLSDADRQTCGLNPKGNARDDLNFERSVCIRLYALDGKWCAEFNLSESCSNENDGNKQDASVSVSCKTMELSARDTKLVKDKQNEEVDEVQGNDKKDKTTADKDKKGNDKKDKEDEDKVNDKTTEKDEDNEDEDEEQDGDILSASFNYEYGSWSGTSRSCEVEAFETEYIAKTLRVKYLSDRDIIQWVLRLFPSWFFTATKYEGDSDDLSSMWLKKIDKLKEDDDEE